MAPGSRGIGAVFVHFSGEDSDQTGDAFGEPRVPRRSWSRYLSNAPGLADQLVASRKDSAREGGCPGGKNAFCSQRVFSQILSQFARIFDLAPDVGFRRSWYRRKACAAYFCKVPDSREIRAWTFLTITLLVSRPFSTRKVSNRSSHHVLQNGQGAVSSIQLFGLVNGVQWALVGSGNGSVKPRSNLRSTLWSNLVNLGQTWSEPWEMCPGPSSWEYLMWQALVRIRPAWFGLPRFACRHPRKSRGRAVRLGLRASPSGGPNGHSKGLEKIGRDAKRWIVARKDEMARVWELARDHHARRVMDPREDSDRRSVFAYTSYRDDLAWVTTQVSNRGYPTVWILEIQTRRDDLAWVTTQVSNRMSDRGSGSGGHRRSDRLAKGKAVIYAPETAPLIQMTSGALMPRLPVLSLGAARPPLLPGVIIGRSARPSGTTRPSPQPSATTGPSDTPPDALRRPHTRSTGIPPSRLKRQRAEGIPDSAGAIPEDYVAPGFRYPPQGGIRPRYPVAVEISDTPLLTNLLAHPSSLVRRCQDPPESVGRGAWSEFSKLLAISRREYREFLTELGFGPFLGIPYVSVYHPSVGCFVERFFHHTGTFHLSTCEMAVLPVDWSAILGIRFGEGKKLPSVRVRYLADVLRRDREEPPTELRYRQWAAYFIFSCFLGNDKSTVPTPIVGMFRDIDALREYDWGALTYGFYIRGLRRYSRRESISFLGFWQFTIFWAFEHFPGFAPSRLPLASDPDFPLARRWDSSRIRRMTTRTLLELRMTVDCIRDAEIVFQPYSAALTQRPEVFRAVELSHLRIWIRSPRSWELLLAERTLRQLGGEAVVPVDPSPLMTIEGYIPRAPSDPYVAGVSVYPGLVREDVPYQEWFERVSLGSLMSLHQVEGGRVMGGMAMDSHHIRSSGQIERLESEILRLQLELSVSVDRHTADMDPSTGRDGQYADGGDIARRGDGADASRLGPEVEGFGFPRCRGGPSCCRRTEIRGAASGYGYYSCYWSWPVWFWSDFFFATS
uniref:Aminotransferase-like plant mobile domain-containing protein n=1 Tax=Fagus sylvatica TaxID=28930 RepID=A0A2N9GKC5_FAGSY